MPMSISEYNDRCNTTSWQVWVVVRLQLTAKFRLLEPNVANVRSREAVNVKKDILAYSTGLCLAMKRESWVKVSRAILPEGACSRPGNHAWSPLPMKEQIWMYAGIGTMAMSHWRCTRIKGGSVSLGVVLLLLWTIPRGVQRVECLSLIHISEPTRP